MRKLISDKRFINVFKFLILYRFAMQFLVLPLFMYLGKLLMRFYNVQFLSTDKILSLLTKPSIWSYIVFGLISLFFLLVLELAATITLSQFTLNKENLLQTVLDKIKWTLKPINLIFLPILLIILLGFNFGMTSMITDSFFIPEFIMDTIIKTPSYMFLYSVISVLGFIIAFYLVFVFHNIFIANNNIKDAIKNSINMVSGNKINFLISAIKLGFKISVTTSILYLLAVIILILLVYTVPPFFSFTATSLSILFVLNKLLVFLIVIFIASINVMFITQKYGEYGGKVLDYNYVNTYKYKLIPKQLSLLFLLITLLFQGFGAFMTITSFNSPKYLDHKVYVTSHRGNSSVAPENTIAAIKAAKDDQADAVEIDVQLSADGQVVVIHDFTLSRLANDKRRVIDLTLDQLKALEVGSWFSKEFTGEKIPTLQEVIDASKPYLKINIELKPTNDEAMLAQAVVKIIKDNDVSNKIVISSLNKQALKEVKKLDQDLKVGYIVPIALGKFEFEDEIDFYSLEMSFLSKNLVEKIKNQDKEVHAWTVNSEADIKKMQRLQVNNIITDNPLLARKILATNIFERGILELLAFIDL